MEGLGSLQPDQEWKEERLVPEKGEGCRKWMPGVAPQVKGLGLGLLAMLMGKIMGETIKATPLVRVP